MFSELIYLHVHALPCKDGNYEESEFILKYLCVFVQLTQTSYHRHRAIPQVCLAFMAAAGVARRGDKQSLHI